MTDALSPARFAALAEAYGGDLARWPAAVRDAAAAALARDPVAAALLGEVARLDVALDRWRVPAPRAALVGAVLAVAPGLPLAWTRARLWWSGIGFAGVGLGGALAGALLASVTPPPFAGTHLYADEDASFFGDIDVVRAAR